MRFSDGQRNNRTGCCQENPCGLHANVTYFSRLRVKNLAWDSSFLYPIRLAGRSAVSCDTEAWPCRCNPTYDRKLSGVLLDGSYRVGPPAHSPNHTPG